MTAKFDYFTNFYISDENEVIIATKRFVIINTNGDKIFSTNPAETSMTAKKMRLSGISLIPDADLIDFLETW